MFRRRRFGLGVVAPSLPDAAVELRTVTVDESAAWLAAGWRDLRRTPVLSLSVGLAFAALGWLMTSGLAHLGMGSLVLPLGAGFMLVAPLAAMGLYEVSRRHETGQPVTLRAVLSAWTAHGDQIGVMALVLTLGLYVWVQLALLLFMGFFHTAPPPLDDVLGGLLNAPNVVPFLVAGTALGGVLAAGVFTVTVVSLPMLLDRDVTALAAILTSVRVVRHNWRVMIGWAAMIALITFAGLACFYVGLAVALPLVGHASWHAYRGLVR